MDEDIARLRAKTLANLMALAERDGEYLASLPPNKPVRNGNRIQSTARLLLEFSQAKPATELTIDQRTSLTGTIEIELVSASNGQEAALELPQPAFQIWNNHDDDGSEEIQDS